ncbi:MAG: hypothetical protein EZS28_029921, partial [Streblomastix strix]
RVDDGIETETDEYGLLYNEDEDEDEVDVN